MSFMLALQNFLGKHPLLFDLKQAFDIRRTGAFTRDPATTSWSEFGEDDILVTELADLLKTGYYVDVGANLPTKRSATFRLYRMGMRGITVEPNPALANLQAKHRPGDIQLGAGTGERDGAAIFYQISTHGLSTFSEERCQALVADGHHLLSRRLFPILMLRTILRDCIFPDRPVFALLAVDAESMDEIVLRSNDWETNRPRIVIFEDNDDTGEASRFLASVGYRSIAKRGSNRVMKLMAADEGRPYSL